MPHLWYTFPVAWISDPKPKGFWRVIRWRLRRFWLFKIRRIRPFDIGKHFHPDTFGVLTDPQQRWWDRGYWVLPESPFTPVKYTTVVTSQPPDKIHIADEDALRIAAEFRRMMERNMLRMYPSLYEPTTDTPSDRPADGEGA
jgi:hypothetical protein